MSERKPISIDFLIPGTPDAAKDEIDRKLEDLERQMEAAAQERLKAQEQAEGAVLQAVGQVDEDDPDRLLEALVQNMKETGELPASADDKKSPDDVVKDIANRAKTARHNAHLTQLRMIEMERRRQRRAAREGKGKK